MTHVGFFLVGRSFAPPTVDDLILLSHDVLVCDDLILADVMAINPRLISCYVFQKVFIGIGTVKVLTDVNTHLFLMIGQQM